MKPRKTLGILVTIVLLGAIFAVWGFDGLAVYLAVKLLAVLMLWALWKARRRLASIKDDPGC